MKNILLDLLGFGAVLSSILVITSKNPVISVLFLITLFINAAGYLIITGITFLGLAYILVYIGAIIVLFLFVIMMINIKLADILETGSEYTKSLPLALSIGGLFLYELTTISPFTNNNILLFSYPFEILNYLNNIFLNFLNFENNYNLINFNYNTINLIAFDSIFNEFKDIEALGQGLYTYSAFLFLLVGIILLLAMVAPIIFSGREK